MSGHVTRLGSTPLFRRGTAWGALPEAACSVALRAAVCLSLCLGVAMAMSAGRADAAAPTRPPASSASTAPVAFPTSFTSSAPSAAAEKRLAAITAELRCLVCQNESLAASQADLAKDLRREILVMIEAGKSDDEIVDFMVSRYGDFVRYRPPLKPSTWLLWSGPFLLLAGGLGGLVCVLRRQSHRAETPPLSAEERRRADRLLAGEERRES